MEHVDHVAARVSLAALSGLLGGAALATLKGSPLPKTSISMAASCALVGTACFGFERLSNVAIKQVMHTNNADKQAQQRLFYGSHALGGMIGGGVTGALFQHRPIPGIMLCTPLMVAVAYAEQTFQEERQERLRQRQLMASKPKETLGEPNTESDEASNGER